MIVALDLSLSETGYAIGFPGEPYRVGTIRTGLQGMERLRSIRTRVLELVRGADLVVIEGYSFASRHQAHQLGELGGVVRLALHEAGFRYVEVPPSTLKTYGAGRGNAGKEEMLTAAVRRLGYAGHNNNEADALWLLAMAADASGWAWAQVPAAHRTALGKVKWT